MGMGMLRLLSRKTRPSMPSERARAAATLQPASSGKNRIPACQPESGQQSQAAAAFAP